MLPHFPPASSAGVGRVALVRVRWALIYCVGPLLFVSGNEYAKCPPVSAWVIRRPPGSLASLTSPCNDNACEGLWCPGTDFIQGIAQLISHRTLRKWPQAPAFHCSSALGSFTSCWRSKHRSALFISDSFRPVCLIRTEKCQQKVFFCLAPPFFAFILAKRHLNCFYIQCLFLRLGLWIFFKKTVRN